MKDTLMLSLKKESRLHYGSSFFFPPLPQFKIFQDYQNLPVKKQHPIYFEKVNQIIGEEEFEY